MTNDEVLDRFELAYDGDDEFVAVLAAIAALREERDEQFRNARDMQSAAAEEHAHEAEMSARKDDRISELEEQWHELCRRTGYVNEHYGHCQYADLETMVKAVEGNAEQIDEISGLYKKIEDLKNVLRLAQRNITELQDVRNRQYDLLRLMVRVVEKEFRSWDCMSESTRAFMGCPTFAQLLHGDKFKVLTLEECEAVAALCQNSEVGERDD